jgi:hypothetical protein
MVPAISSASVPALQVGERLPVLPAAEAYTRAAVNEAATAPAIAVQFDPNRPTKAAKASSLGARTTTEQAAVQDASLPPRRRAQDTTQAPGFPASPYVAQLLAQQAFPPTPTTLEDGLAAYQAAVARNGPSTGNSISLQA